MFVYPDVDMVVVTTAGNEVLFNSNALQDVLEEHLPRRALICRRFPRTSGPIRVCWLISGSFRIRHRQRRLSGTGAGNGITGGKKLPQEDFLRRTAGNGKKMAGSRRAEL
ncbi:MAG: hypothetical protein ACLR2E_20970 [Lachnospiraceae bacterium]